MIRLTIIAAQSLDGFINRHNELGTDFCSPEDQRFLSDALKEFDCMIMGKITFDTLRERITQSTSTRYLRKICTREPELYQSHSRPNAIEFTNASPANILEDLSRRGRQNCVLLGGSQTYTRFLRENLVDRLWITFEPRLFGMGAPLVQGKVDYHFTLEDVERLSKDTIMAKYLRKG